MKLLKICMLLIIFYVLCTENFWIYSQQDANKLTINDETMWLNKIDIDKNFCCGKLCLKYLHLNKYNVYFLSKYALDVANTNHFDFIEGSHYLHKLLNYPFLYCDGITKWGDNVIKRSNKLQHLCLKIT